MDCSRELVNYPIKIVVFVGIGNLQNCLTDVLYVVQNISCHDAITIARLVASCANRVLIV